MLSSSTTRYVADILSQPSALRALQARRSNHEPAAAIIRARGQIVLTGMGASFAALWPAWRRLVNAGLSAWHIETAELLSLGGLLRKPGMVFIAASQSGRSAELLSLAERIHAAHPLIAITNDPASPLATSATTVVEMHAGAEHAVSTRTYLNTLSVAGALVSAVNGEESTEADERIADAMDSYLEHWRSHVDSLKDRVGTPSRTVILGRDESFAAALYGGLILKEAAKWPVEGCTPAQFRHGPLEIADERLSALILAGTEPISRERNLKLANDIERYGGHAFWIDSEAIPGIRHIDMPRLTGAARAAAEVVPLQLLSVAIAELTGIEPGTFRHLSKVTTIE
jgi:glutamine---fructose-6-phosphate transaminase (isomerizing)